MIENLIVEHILSGKYNISVSIAHNNNIVISMIDYTIVDSAYIVEIIDDDGVFVVHDFTYHVEGDNMPDIYNLNFTQSQVNKLIEKFYRPLSSFKNSTIVDVYEFSNFLLTTDNQSPFIIYTSSPDDGSTDITIFHDDLDFLSKVKCSI